MRVPPGIDTHCDSFTFIIFKICNDTKLSYNNFDMSRGFFENPFNQETNVKLDLYKNYLKEWFPVFIAGKNPFKKTINVFDCFAGPGTDSEGKFGSPMLALEVLNEYSEYVLREDININLYFNDSKKIYIERLKQNIDNFNFKCNKNKLNIHFSNEKFEVLFGKLIPLMNDAANLVFLDQFGIKYVDSERFRILINQPVTDILFFISSSTFKRFPNDHNVTKVLGLTAEDIQSRSHYEIHKLIFEKYTNFIPDEYSYCLAPFSMKKGSNIYGLIFGSGHPLGMEKFLDLCWKKDETTGEANFDIIGDQEKYFKPSLFESQPSKIEAFQIGLENAILNRILTTDLEIFLYMINNGFIAKHVKPVVKKLKRDGKIELKRPSFKCATVWKHRSRRPKKINVM